MLCVYPANCTDFSNNGMGVIYLSATFKLNDFNIAIYFFAIVQYTIDDEVSQI